MGETIRAELQRTKDTKNMARFDVAADHRGDAPVPTVYVRKDALEELGAPASVVVTITAADAS